MHLGVSLWRLQGVALLLTVCAALAEGQVAPVERGSRVLPGVPLELGLLQIAVGSGIPIGFESANARGERVANDSVVDVRPATVELALSRVLGPGTKYEWARVGGIIVVHPREGRSPHLDSPVKLQVRDESLSVAAALIRDLYRNPLMPPDGASDSTAQGSGEKKLTASGATIREFLNALIEQHGQAMWMWGYVNTSAVGERIRSEVKFRTFQGSMLAYLIGSAD